MSSSVATSIIFRRYIALPQDHGSWVFIISPLLAGLFAGGVWKSESIYLIVAAMAAFLLRQPVTMLVKVYTGRRPKRDLFAAWFWTLVYGLIATVAFSGLLFLGYGYLAFLALPGLPVFAWHLYLVGKRTERRQIGIELIGSGVLALAAPAAFWVALGRPDPLGWLLWALLWLQSGASILYAYLRLQQRERKHIAEPSERWKMARKALTFTTFNLLLVTGLTLTGIVPLLLPLPYLLQWGESIYGTLKPAVNLKPTTIGFRQLSVSSLFTLLFILAWIV